MRATKARAKFSGKSIQFQNSFRIRGPARLVPLSQDFVTSQSFPSVGKDILVVFYVFSTELLVLIFNYPSEPLDFRPVVLNVLYLYVSTSTCLLYTSPSPRD